jgi:hypothetical protein
MRKMMCSLIAVATATGCGSGSDSDDTAAPTISIQAPAAVEGGDTVAITVTASDNFDPSVTATLSCTGGTLTGNMLRVNEVTQPTTLSCSAEATDAAGNKGTANVTINVNPTTRTITPMAFATEAVPGGTGSLLATNVTLDQASYEATFNGKTVKLLRHNGNELVYILPIDTPAGAGKLNFQIGGRAFSIDLTVKAQTIGNPRDALARSFEAFRDSVTDAIARPETSAADRAKLQEQLVKLDQAIAQLPTLSIEQATGLATILTANGLVPTISGAFYNPIVGGESCLPRLKTFGRNVFLSALGAGFVVGSITLAQLVATAAPVLVIPDIIIAGLGLSIGTYMFVTYGRDAIKSFPDAKRACWTEVSLNLVPIEQFGAIQSNSYKRPLAVVAKQGFTQEVTRAFKVQRSFAPLAEFRAQITSNVNDIVNAVNSIGLAPADLKAGLGGIEVEGTEFVPVDRVSLGGISRGDISGQVTRSGDNLLVKFAKTNPEVTENIDFSFTLNRTEEAPIEVPAQLVVQLPEADGASVQATQGQQVTSTVTTRGAESLEIVDQPANGTVTLNNNGSFVYKPNGSFFGADQFTYRARNKVGPSKPATVNISVVRKFEGAWTISTKTTTISETPAGLCPNEEAQFGVVVSKVSDTLYTVSYSGFTINLTMGSVDDPAGLKGSITVTYDDGPGETTETLNVSVPNSKQITGTSMFSYTGPNGTACSGRTEITGTR